MNTGIINLGTINIVALRLSFSVILIFVFIIISSIIMGGLCTSIESFFPELFHGDFRAVSTPSQGDYIIININIFIIRTTINTVVISRAPLRTMRSYSRSTPGRFQIYFLSICLRIQSLSTNASFAFQAAVPVPLPPALLFFFPGATPGARLSQ